MNRFKIGEKILCSINDKHYEGVVVVKLEYLGSYVVQLTPTGKTVVLQPEDVFSTSFSMDTTNPNVGFKKINH